MSQSCTCKIFDPVLYTKRNFDPLLIQRCAYCQGLAAEVERLKAELDQAQQELDKLLEYARKVKGSRDVHSVYEVLDMVRSQGEVPMKSVERNLANKILYFLYLHPSRWGGKDKADKEDISSIVVDNAMAPIVLVAFCLLVAVVVVFIVKKLL